MATIDFLTRYNAAKMCTEIAVIDDGSREVIGRECIKTSQRSRWDSLTTKDVFDIKELIDKKYSEHNLCLK